MDARKESAGEQQPQPAAPYPGQGCGEYALGEPWMQYPVDYVLIHEINTVQYQSISMLKCSQLRKFVVNC